LNIYDILTVIGVGASPIAELRAAIPLAYGVYDFPWYYAYLFGVIGNLLPVPFILLLLDGLERLAAKVPRLNRWLNWLLERTRRRGRIVERYKRLGLVLFVAIPLPFTGAWTGSLAAVIFGVKFRHSLLSIILGVLIAGVIVTSASVLGWAVADLFTKS